MAVVVGVAAGIRAVQVREGTAMIMVMGEDTTLISLSLTLFILSLWDDIVLFFIKYLLFICKFSLDYIHDFREF